MPLSDYFGIISTVQIIKFKFTQFFKVLQADTGFIRFFISINPETTYIKLKSYIYLCNFDFSSLLSRIFDEEFLISLNSENVTNLKIVYAVHCVKVSNHKR